MHVNSSNRWHSVWPSIAKNIQIKSPWFTSKTSMPYLAIKPKIETSSIYEINPKQPTLHPVFKGSVALCLPDRPFCRQLMPSWGTGTEQRLSPHLVESVPAQRTVEPSWWFYHVFKGGSSVFQSRILLGTTRWSDLYIYYIYIYFLKPSNYANTFGIPGSLVMILVYIHFAF